jgi:outer membrane lipoprotein-sorting protein
LTRWTAIAWAAALIGAATPTLAAPPPPTPLTASESALVAKAVAYLQELATAKGRFVQTDARGIVTEGTFYLQRPGKARFEYDPPSGLVILSDGAQVSVVDRRLKTIQSYPLGLTPLALFLARDIRLDKGVLVTGVTRETGGFTITARDGRKKADGQIELNFTESPTALKGWAITDIQGRIVRVRLVAFGPAPHHDRKFFQIQDPARSPAPED